MALILESREIPYNSNLTLKTLEQHANGYLRYQNFSDFVSQGPEAVQAYIDRANLLFKRNLNAPSIMMPARLGAWSFLI